MMNFFAQLAIMVSSVVFGYICIFKHESLWQKLYHRYKSKYQDPKIPKNDIPYNQNLKIGDEKTDSIVFLASEKTKHVI